METMIVYNKYSASGAFVAERVYKPTSKDDYDRVMRIIEENPDEYELVNVEYEFRFREV